MKIQYDNKLAAIPPAKAIHKAIAGRANGKPSAHRYERRKVREQLRHLDWALAGVD